MTHVWNAARSGDAESLQVLIAQGYDINETGGVAKMTPLAIAAFCEKFECVSILLDNNADVTAVDNEGETALYRFVHIYSIQAYEKNLSRREIEILIDIADRMLKMGANASFFNSSGGDSILSRAIDTGVVALVKLVVEHGADPSAICTRCSSDYVYFPPSTALIHAIEHKNTENSLELVKLLIDFGADLSIRDGHQAPLFAAIKWVPLGLQNPEDMLRLLFDNQVFLSEDTTVPVREMTEDEMVDPPLIPISSVGWLAEFAVRRGRPVSAAIIKAEPENRKRKFKWEEERREKRRDIFNMALHPRDSSDLSGLPQDLIDKLSRMI